LTPFTPKQRKNFDFYLASMESCSRPNYGTVSHIHIALGAMWIWLTAQVASRDMTLKV